MSPGSDAGEVIRALFFLCRGVCHTCQSDACFDSPPFCVTGVKNTDEIRRHFASTPNLPPFTRRATPTPATTPTRKSSLSLQDICHMRTRPHQDSVVEHSSFSKPSDPSSRSHFASKRFPASLLVPSIRPHRRPRNRSLHPRRSSFKATTPRHAGL